MTIKAIRLKRQEEPGRTELYEVREPRNIVVKESQKDNSLDRVILEYRIKNSETGYFVKEYRPAEVEKTGAKVIDITAVMLNQERKCIRWHLYDIKDTLAGENTVVKLYEQWNAGLRYLKHIFLANLPEWSVMPDLGVITRCYDEERMKRLRDAYLRAYDDKIKAPQYGMTLPQRKKRTEIAKYRGILTAVQAILDRELQTEEDTYEIHIRKLSNERDSVYEITFPV